MKDLEIIEITAERAQEMVVTRSREKLTALRAVRRVKKSK